jgi:hypothetical protein
LLRSPIRWRNEPMSGLFFAHALLPDGWARDVRLVIDGGIITEVHTDTVVHADDTCSSAHSRGGPNGGGMLPIRSGRGARNYTPLPCG